MSTKFYTFNPAAYATEESSAYTHASYPFLNALSPNRNLLWKVQASPPSPPQMSGVIDLGGGRICTGIAFDVRSGSSFNPDTTIDIAFSTDNVSFTDYRTDEVLDVDAEITVIDFVGAPIAQRYHRFTVAAASGTLPTFGGVWMCLSHTIGVDPQQSLEDDYEFAGNALVMPNGDILSRNMTGKTHRRFKRTYYLTATQWDELLEVFQESLGPQYPVVMIEGTNDPVVVKFNQQQLKRTWAMYGLWKVELDFLEVPFIADGALY